LNISAVQGNSNALKRKGRIQMTAGMINGLQAISGSPSDTATKPFRQMPPKLDSAAVIATLQALGLTIPTKLVAATTREQSRAAGHRFPLKEVDAALAKADVSITNRFRLKEAMSENGILGN
jgi:hypothetical protein